MKLPLSHATFNRHLAKPCLDLVIRHWLVCLCVLFWLLNQVWEPKLFQILALSSQAIQNHHYWVLLSCNLMHANAAHLMINLTAYCILFQWVKPLYNTHQFAVITLVIGLITAVILQSLFSIGWYVGLSAALHGLMAGIIGEEWKRHKAFAIGLGIGLLAKLAYEWATQGETLNTQWLNMDVFWQSHSIGFAVGACLFFAIEFVGQRLRGRQLDTR